MASRELLPIGSNEKAQFAAYCLPCGLFPRSWSTRISTIVVHDERKSSRKGFLEVAAKLRIERGLKPTCASERPSSGFLSLPMG